MGVIQSHQLDIGVGPGQVPVFSDIGTLTLGADPVNDFDAVTLRYVNHLINQIQPNTISVDLSNIHNELTNLQNQINDINIINNVDFNKKVDTIQNNMLILELAVKDLKTQITPPPIPTNLISYKNYIKLKINQLVSAARIKFISDTLGQSEVYREKLEQAIDYLLQRETVDIDLYPLVRIDAEVYGISYTEAAENIIQQKKKWMKHTCGIEKLRLILKKDVDLAPSIEYIDTLIDQFITDLATLYKENM